MLILWERLKMQKGFQSCNSEKAGNFWVKHWVHLFTTTEPGGILETMQPSLVLTDQVGAQLHVLLLQFCNLLMTMFLISNISVTACPRLQAREQFRSLQLFAVFTLLYLWTSSESSLEANGLKSRANEDFRHRKGSVSQLMLQLMK